MGGAQLIVGHCLWCVVLMDREEVGMFGTDPGEHAWPTNRHQELAWSSCVVLAALQGLLCVGPGGRDFCDPVVCAWEGGPLLCTERSLVE